MCFHVYTTLPQKAPPKFIHFSPGVVFLPYIVVKRVERYLQDTKMLEISIRSCLLKFRNTLLPKIVFVALGFKKIQYVKGERRIYGKQTSA